LAPPQGTAALGAFFQLVRLLMLAFGCYMAFVLVKRTVMLARNMGKRVKV